MNNSAARACAALLAVCAATTPALALAASTTLQNPGGETLTEEQSAFVRVPLEDPYGLALFTTELLAVGTPAGQWTLVDDMAKRRNPNRTYRRHQGEDLVIGLAPGSYLLRVACTGASEHQFDAQPVEVAAGREYVVECRGLKSDARMRIADQAALPYKVIRPVRTAVSDLPAGFQNERIAQAVKAALAHRGWEVLNEQSGRIDAIHRDVRDSTRISIQYDPQEARFDFLEGKTHEEDGEAAAHFSYYFRIRLLGQDIGKHLAGEPLTD